MCCDLEGSLTTVVARVCFDALKRRMSRREELTLDDPRRDIAAVAPGELPEEEAVLADSIGVALLILLDALPPVERVAFVLHDMFDVPFDDITIYVEERREWFSFDYSFSFNTSDVRTVGAFADATLCHIMDRC